MSNCGLNNVITFDELFNIDSIDMNVYDICGNIIDKSNIQYSYSNDSINWSCYVNYDTFLCNIKDIKSDIYVRLKLQGSPAKIENQSTPINFYSNIDNGFTFNVSDDSNLYNPYNNLTNVLQLQDTLSNSVVNMFGIACYYFKLSPNAGSKDLTFKEYTLMGVESVKQIKIVVQDGTMPSSKPEFTDFGLDFQPEFMVEISKSMFATAFGTKAQPMEGDFIYVPMMKRMWMVNGAYEEKNENLMWQATTFRVMLVKYQEKGSVDLAETEELVNTLVKNKYEDLFDDETMITGSGEESVTENIAEHDNLYPIFKTDATRQYANCKLVNFDENNSTTYYRGTIISDRYYSFMTQTMNTKTIVYQRKFCGDCISISFIVRPESYTYKEGIILYIGDNIKLMFDQEYNYTTLYLNVNKNLSIKLNNNQTYFVFLRWSKALNIAELSAALYTYNQNIPIYKVNNNHYYYDIDNLQTCTIPYDIELSVLNKEPICLGMIYGKITNIKVFSVYIDNITELLQMYPTHNELIINDTCRQFITLNI